MRRDAGDFNRSKPSGYSSNYSLLLALQSPLCMSSVFLRGHECAIQQQEGVVSDQVRHQAFFSRAKSLSGASRRGGEIRSAWEQGVRRQKRRHSLAQAHTQIGHNHLIPILPDFVKTLGKPAPSNHLSVLIETVQ